MNYTVKEIFFTLQGEGGNTGRPAIFCRFAGCNLWTGREQDRARAVCTFCDTDFVGTDGLGGGKFTTAADLAGAISTKWPGNGSRSVNPLVVCTGGEPLLQLDSTLVNALHDKGFEIAVETNGTRLPPPGIDWICVSPKAGAGIVLLNGQELKLVFPQPEPEARPERFEKLDFEYFFLQPMDGPDRDRNIDLTVQYCLEHPQWRLSLQTQKILGIP